MLVGEEIFDQWQKRGLIRATPLPSGASGVRVDELARLPAGRFTGFAPVREDDSVTQVERARPIR